MLAILGFLSLGLLTAVVSQPLFYWLALGRASRQLGAGAYVELRQQINAAITVRLTRLYIATLVSLLGLVAVAVWQSVWTLATGAGVAALGLIADSVLATKLNVPINERMNGWSPMAPPSDWQRDRERWDAAFALRRVVLLTAFIALALAWSIS